jgi:cellulose synthase/poly-beta-1,6-N-acetylglucosamine synthase-like glycosyltransferase
LKHQSTRDIAEHDDGLELLPLTGSFADRTEVATSSERADGPRLSVVVPAMNEEGNIPALHQAIADVLEATGITFELILVDDGSIDGTWQAIEALSARDRVETSAKFRQGARAGNGVRGGIG